jgi:cytochrome c-type biogenesis protein CcmH
MNGVSGRWLLAIAVVVGAAVLGWGWYGRSKPATPAIAPAADATHTAASSAAPAPLSASQVERSIQRVRESLNRDPNDASNWAMLAHSYEMIGRFDLAAEAYNKLLALRPQDAQIQADYADALGVVQRGSLRGEPSRLIAGALALDPGNLKALVLGGKAAFERAQYGQAIALWQRALGATQDPAIRRPIETGIAEARALSSPVASSAASAVTGLGFVAGRVTVSAALKSRIGADDTVFIYARPTAGSRMPVALLRKLGRDVPLDFALDDTLAMVPDKRLSMQRTVMVGARISKRGDAIPGAGDLEGEIGPIDVGATGLVLEVNRVRP